MGEQNVQLIEQSVKNNTQDIREMKKEIDKLKGDVSDVKSNQQLTNQNVSHILETLSDLKVNFKDLDNKLDQDREARREDEIANLKEYKSFMWKVSAGIAVTVLGGIFTAAALI